ncbi:uncharacterized protein LOC113496617, partial [Trichoplusia ni]|uniref:Uncharacterized protein LOC113496617 n=1 Tax=Trichoplusia ni TaxID=7111 RepID=A0A7E5VTM0_TRINI
NQFNLLLLYTNSTFSCLQVILIAAVCWLTLCQALGVNSAVTNSAVVKDNKSAASAPRLYRNVPVGVYASAAPYASYSFHLPQFIAAPKASASQVAPIKQKPQNVQTYLMDSYGNKFMESPQLAPYRTAFPQQFVALQSKLPEHLAQPLVAASPNFQFKQSAPQVFFGAPFRVPALQSPAPTPLNHFPTFGQHLVYANKVQSLAPNWNLQNHGVGVPSAQQQPSNNKAVFANTQNHEQYGIVKNEQKFQRLREPELIIGKPKLQNVQEPSHQPNSESKFQRIQEIPQPAHGETKFQRLQESPQVSNSDANYQHEKPKVKHEKDKFQRIQESSYESNDEANAFQHHQESPKVLHVEHSYSAPKHQGDTSQSDKAQQQGAPAKQTTITYVNNINGKQSIVKVKTQPLPLLDLTLLEPLTFKNPLVPQVQHFLPRINQATYQKLPDSVDTVNNYQKGYVVQKTMSYDSGNQDVKPQKKKQKKTTQTNKHAKKSDAPKKTSVPHHETLDDAPEIVYEINAPGHKETYKEKAVSYNKETQSEPVHYTYGSKTENDPATYSYSRTTKEPVREVHYHTNNPGPAHLNYNFKPDKQHKESEGHSPPHSEPANHEDTSKESEDENLQYNHQHYTGNYNENTKPSVKHYEPVHKEHYHKVNQAKQEESSNADPSKYYSTPNQPSPQFFNLEPIIKEYSEDISLLNNAQIKVDPDQHVKTPSRQHESSPNREQSYTPHESHYSSPHNKPPQQSAPENHYYSSPHSESYAPTAHIQEKSKRVIIQEEAPDERHSLTAQMKEEVVDQEENNEEDFEKAYKNAAIGFPAYSKEALDAAEKDIFDPESYGVPPDHVEYDIENTPFQQYQEEGDSFPKETRSNYKDARDKMKEDYYTDYSVSKPESLLDRYQNKLGYYKLYKQQKPDYYVPKHSHDDDKKQNQKFAKYSVSPSFDFSSSKESKDKSHYSGHYKPQQALHEFDYSNGSPRDNSAFASRPYQRYKSKTNFVEPQFQYGFEPLAIPKLLDSELSAMASNHRPESEKPAMRKKVYKENWYIKKTSTSAGAPSS